MKTGREWNWYLVFIGIPIAIAVSLPIIQMLRNL